MKCTVRPADIADVELLATLKAACTRENYRGFFDFAPLNEQNEENITTFFLKVFANSDAHVFILQNSTDAVGYAVLRKVQNEQGQTEGEFLAIDVLPNVSMDQFHKLIIAAAEGIADKDISQVFIYLLNNNFRIRFVFEHIGFKKDGTALTQILQEERFELLRYVYRV
jgi:hypothetical protein